MGRQHGKWTRFRAFRRVALWVTQQVEADPDYWRSIQRNATDEVTFQWASYGAARVAKSEDIRRFIAATQPESWKARRAGNGGSESLHQHRPEGGSEGKGGYRSNENFNDRGKGSGGLSPLTGPLTMEKLERRGDELGV